jgi:hypothetical protein
VSKETETHDKDLGDNEPGRVSYAILVDSEGVADDLEDQTSKLHALVPMRHAHQEATNDTK